MSSRFVSCSPLATKDRLSTDSAPASHNCALRLLISGPTAGHQWVIHRSYDSIYSQMIWLRSWIISWLREQY
jgi:hypothetical protein